MKKYRYTIIVLISFISLPLLLSNLTLAKDEEIHGFHSQAELTHFQMIELDTSLPKGYSYLFAGSGICQKCHGYDSLGLASVDVNGDDVNLVDDWRATMMANSAKDPFWRAKVSHEVLLYPEHKVAIEDKCTSCHVPMGNLNAKHLGALHYGIEDMLGDSLALDGVSCLACHLQEQTGLGTKFSGLLTYDTFRLVYGPYMSPLGSPMLTETGYNPKFSAKMDKSETCATCHTLITETLDYQGNVTGNQFVEQATYHEWLNSAYQDSLACQGCHMPSLDKWPVHIVTGAQTEPRLPFYLHELVGGNVTMLGLLRDNVEPLGLTAGPSQFQDVIGKTTDQLQNRTLLLNLELLERTPDTAKFALKLTNLAGHKFPSGYPSRRAFIQFVVVTEAGDTVFVSGKMDGNYEVWGQNPTYEPHYQTISSEDEVQIYEMVMGDVNNDVTTVLERADHPIKDNRLPPLGFSTSHPAYDTTLIAGAALSDPDFNHENGVEGSGSDMVFFNIPMHGEKTLLFVKANVFYQPTPPKWMLEMFAETTPEIEAFKPMFAAADRAPVLVRSAELMVDPLISGVNSKNEEAFVQIYPNPTTDGHLFVKSSARHEVRVFDLNGRQVAFLRSKTGNYEMNLTGRGVFLLQFKGRNGQLQTEKIIVK